MGYGSLWDTYGFVTQQFASAAPLMVTHGNHESDVRTFFAPPLSPLSCRFFLTPLLFPSVPSGLATPTRGCST